MDNMQHMQHFTRGLKVHTRMLLNVSVGGTMRTKNEDEQKELIEKICQNEHHSQSERGVKNEGQEKGVLELDTNKTLLAQLEVLTKRLVGATIMPTNVNQVQAPLCNFYRDKGMLMATTYQKVTQKKHNMHPIFEEVNLIKCNNLRSLLHQNKLWPSL